jgi:hypothetical protein
MPVLAAQAAARPAERAVDKMTRGQLCALLLLLGVGVALTIAAVRRAPQGGVRVPGRVTEDVLPFTPPAGAQIVGPDQHLRGVVYSAHRYPSVCGGDVSAVIKYGHRPLLIPHERDTNWLTAPPSEVTL